MASAGSSGYLTISLDRSNIRQESATMPRVLVVGSINTDLIVRCARVPEEGETVHGDNFATAGGGKGANQAVAASRLGAR